MLKKSDPKNKSISFYPNKSVLAKFHTQKSKTSSPVQIFSSFHPGEISVWLMTALSLILFDMGLFNRQSTPPPPTPPYHNFLVIALSPLIMKFGTGIKLGLFYTMVTKRFVTSLLLRNYDVITCILADAWP